MFYEVLNIYLNYESVKIYFSEIVFKHLHQCINKLYIIIVVRDPIINYKIKIHLHFFTFNSYI